MRNGLVGAGLVLVLLLGGMATARADYEYTAESPGCGHLRFYPPRAAEEGWLSDSQSIRGPAGALFGRTVGAVKAQLVDWQVPLSDGARVKVHRLLLPALRQVEANLAKGAAGGLGYEVRAADTYGYNARTSVAHDGISYHGLGAAIDINSTSNPYRLDGVLITDMPGWFVEAWESAGMCWGGNWNYAKDPMHFSWSGPKATADVAMPKPLPPLTEARGFSAEAGRQSVVFGAATLPRFVVEASGDGAPDVAQIRPWGGAAVVELATSRSGYRDCSVWRWWLDDPPSGNPVFADLTGVGRPDLVYLNESGPTLVLSPRAVASSYAAAPDITTGAPTGRRYVFADVDGDGADDLVAMADRLAGTEIQVWSASSSFAEVIEDTLLEGHHLTNATRLGAADRDVDGLDDLFLVEPGSVASVISVVSSKDMSVVMEVTGGPAIDPSDITGFEDYDGDGRPDLMRMDPAGELAAFLGNTPLGGSASSWFVPDDFECREGTVPYHHEGRFADDDDSEFQADIEWLATRQVTRGCNPPFEDWFCPDDAVTRGEMAAFLTRALKLVSASARFVDVDRSVFRADIGALAGAGITRGCNPPMNDRFCPNAPVTRGQMAAFLTRALKLAPAAGRFVDGGGSVFRADIGALAEAGITRGCNPPMNDRFCPNAPVTRGQMAAFLRRAEGWLPDA